MNKKWVLYEADEQKVKEISKKYELPEIIAKIIIDRGISEDKDIKTYLNPTRNDFEDPFLMPDMDIAVEQILNALAEKEKVIIQGDYDVDGITSITVLKKFLDEHGLPVDYYVPNRLDEGYGLNKNAIQKIASQGYKLIITVDCGISGIEEINLANDLKMKVIVTDHHEPGETLPNAVAVVDAKRKDNEYPCNVLARSWRSI